MTTFGPLVATDWLAERIGDPTIKIIDGSWRMPGSPPASIDYEKRHIEGAIFFDLDEVSDHQTELPHMLPSPEQFARQVGTLGISNNDTLIVYDDQGCFSAARIWWTFRTMGHSYVAVLDGGLPKWIAEKRSVVNHSTSPTVQNYTVAFDPSTVSSHLDLKIHLNQKASTVLDARSKPRFDGTVAEPREGLRSGHMPGSINLPFQAFFNDDQTFLAPGQLAEIFAAHGVEKDKMVITTCGSGVTAAILSLALELIGHSNHKLYDGAWAEWGDIRHNEREFPVVVGSAK